MYEISPFSHEDVSEVVAFAELWAEENITYGLVPPSNENLNERIGSLFYIVEYELSVVGFAFGSLHTSEGLAVIPKDERYIEVDDIYIHPDHRSKALGSRLLNHLLKEAESQGVVRSLVYSATKDWEKITKFYKNNGYKMWYVQMYK